MVKRNFEIKPIPNRLPPVYVPKLERPDVGVLDQDEKETLLLEMLVQAGLAITQRAGGTPEEPARKRVLAAKDIKDMRGNILFKKGTVLYFRDMEAISHAFARGDILKGSEPNKPTGLRIPDEEELPAEETEKK